MELQRGAEATEELRRMAAAQPGNQDRHRLIVYLAQRVPSLFLASSFRSCLNCAVLKCIFAWGTRYPLS